MLEGGIDMASVAEVIALQSLYESAADDARQHRIFAECFLHSRPPGIARNIQNRAVADMRSLQTRLGCNSGSHLLYEVRIECPRLCQRGGKNRRPDGHMPVGALLGKEQRNAQTRVLHGIPLQLIERFRCQLRGQSRFERFTCPGVGTKRGPKQPNRHVLHLFFESG